MTAWEAFLAAARRRRLGRTDAGAWTCPACGRESLIVLVDDELLNPRCARGCAVSAIARALRIEAEFFIPEYADEILRDRAARTDSGLRLLTAQDFEGDEAPDAIVDRLIYRASTHTLNGASKTGKSFLAYQLCMAVSSGRELLSLPTEQATVLLVSLELSAGSVRRRMQAIADSTGLPMPDVGRTFFIAAPTRSVPLALNLATDDGRERLLDAIDDCGAEVVVLDTLYRFLPGRDPSSNQDMGEDFGHLNEIAQKSGAALVVLDHVPKGEFAGPVAHSGIGAQVKGGASAVVASLRRTSREDGGRWQLDVDSWYGSWDEPLYYERPRLHDGTRGTGCVVCTASEAHALPLERLRELFAKYGERDTEGRPYFRSKNAVTQALIAAKITTGNADSADVIAAIQRDYCVPKGAAFGFDKPITTSDGPNRAVTFTWRPTLDAAEMAAA